MIDIEKSENLLNKKLSELRPNSCKKVVWICSSCGKEEIKSFRYAKKFNKCLSCSNTENARNSVLKRSLSMKEWFKTNPSPRLGKIAHGTRGEFKGVKMRSSWEIKVAEYFDKNSILWEYEKYNFPIIIEGKNYTYTPDFYLPEKDCYIEVKGYWRDNAKEKFLQFEKEYPYINIKIWHKEKLKELEIL